MAFCRDWGLGEAISPLVACSCVCLFMHFRYKMGAHAIWNIGRNPRSPSSALSHPFLGEGSPTKIDYRKKGTRILTSLLEDLESDPKRPLQHFAV